MLYVYKGREEMTQTEHYSEELVQHCVLIVNVPSLLLNLKIMDKYLLKIPPLK